MSMLPHLPDSLDHEWWAFPLLTLFGLIDLVIAILDLRPGLPMAFEIVYLVFELLSLFIFCWMFTPVFEGARLFPHLWWVIVFWLLPIPVTLAAIAKSIAAIILTTQGKDTTIISIVGIVVAFILLAYDIVLTFVDVSKKFFSSDITISVDSKSREHRRCFIIACRSICCGCFRRKIEDSEIEDVNLT